jgi:hypothetical protein
MPAILQHKKPVLVLLLVAALLPYLFICLYAFPFADDFCFGWTALENISFTQKFLNQYLGWNGRYTADVLANLHPLTRGGVMSYQVSLLLSLAVTPLVIYLFMREMLVNRERIDSLIAALFITLFYLNYQPDITEGMYWYIGIVNYHVGILCFLLQLTLLLKSNSKQGWVSLLWQAVSVLLLVVSVGFNETGALLIPVFYFTVLLLSYLRSSHVSKVLLVHFILALMASGFVFLAPGNFERAALFSERYQLFHSLWYSSLQTVRFTGTWVLSVPFVLLSVLLAAYSRLIQTKPVKEVDFRILLAACIGVVFTGSFLPYFATGLLGQHRTIDYVFFWFILLWILFILSASNHFSFYTKLDWLRKERNTFLILLIAVLAISVSGNSLKILNDIRQDNFRKYADSYRQRERLIVENTDRPIPALGLIPHTFRLADVKEDTSYWVDKCMRNYYSVAPGAKKP